MISFTIGGQPVNGCSAATVSAGVLTASCTYTPSSTATLAVAATYTGDNNFTVAAQPTLSQTVVPESATLALSGPSTTPTVNQTATFTATFAAAAYTPTPPSGMISFTIGGQSVSGCNPVTVSATMLSASCAYIPTSTATLAVAATYTGDSNFTVASQPTLSQTVNKIPTTLSLVSQPGTSSVNTSVTFTATLATGNSTPTTPTSPGGSISFTVNGDSTVCPSVTLSGGSVTATCVTSKLVYPSDVVVATYSGDGSYATPPSASFTQIVSKISAMTTVTSDTTAAVVNQSVTFTATLQGIPAGQVVPTGNVTFRQGTTILCGGPVAVVVPTSSTATSSSANCQTTFTAVNPNGYTITATYSGDSNFNPGVIGTATPVTVASQPITAVAVVSSPSPSAVDQAVSFTATLRYTYQGTVYPTGTVTFVDQTTTPSVTLCSATVVANGATASCAAPVPLVSQGVHPIVASFTASSPGGGAGANFGNFAPSSTTAIYPQTVNAAATTLSVVTSSASVAVNASVMFTAKVSKPTDPSYTGTLLPSGTITFSDGLNPILSCGPSGVVAVTVLSGTATCTASFATATTHTINAVYTPDTANFLTNSNTASIPQVVGQAITSLTVNSSTPTSIVNQQVTFTALIAFPSGVGTPGGSVTFTDLSTGAALCSGSSGLTLPAGTSPLAVTCTLPFLTSGLRSVQAAYIGDMNFGPSSGTTSQTVNVASATLAVTSLTPTSSVNQPVSFNIVLNLPSGLAGNAVPQGRVTLTDTLTGVALCSVAVSSDGTVNPSTCQTSFTTAGTHSINSVFVSSNANFTGSNTSLNQTVQATSTAVVVSSSSGSSSPTSVAMQPVTFTATVTPSITQGTAVPAGSVTFTLSSGDSCKAVALSPAASSSTASCMVVFASTVSGSVTVSAVFTPSTLASGLSNFQTSVSSTTAPLTQTVLNFKPALTAVSAGGASPPIITQGFSNANDPFNASTITLTSMSLTAAPQSVFSDPLTVTMCTVTSSGSTSPASGITCTPTPSTNSGTGSIATFAIAVGTTAPIGSYTVTVVATNSRVPALVQQTSLTINVAAQVITSSLSAGAATGAFNATFGVPSASLNDTFSYACGNILFNNKVVNNVITCSLRDPATLKLQAGPLSAPLSATPFVITAGPVTYAMASPMRKPAQQIFAAAFLGIPLLALAGCFRRKDTRRSFLRFLAAITVVALASQAIGCGGGFVTTTTVGAAAGTATGTYLVLVTATDTRTQVTYDAVIAVPIVSTTGS